MLSYYAKILNPIMPRIHRVFLSVIVLVLWVASADPVRYRNTLTAWTFRVENESTSYPATIPSSLSLDLIDNGRISKDPYYRDNFLKFYDYETKDVSYSTTFSVFSKYLPGKHQYLIF
jgi:hypothetical protein